MRLPRKSLFFLLCITFSGCVYLRFLEVKRQFANFGSYFQIEEKGGITLVFLKPVLLSEDIAWLMGGKPIYEKKTEEETVWKYVFKKQPPNLDREDFNIPLFLFFKNNRLVRVSFPERFLKYFSKPLLAKMLGSVGSAEVSKLSRKITSGVKIEDYSMIPRREHFIEVMGSPSSIKALSSGYLLTYVYTTEGSSEKENTNLTLHLLFHNRDGHLIRAEGIIRGFSIRFNVFSRDSSSN
ncbi:hypothetical protein HRbin37_01072 [bacterium HR37]|nr:hypothetical protein HRbin37_01072 [bacterium HR37]